MEKELELSGAAGAGGALDSKTYDFASATAGPRTINAAADMSLATNTQGFDPRTIRLDANMSVVQEESDSGRSSSGKMSNLAEAMQVDEDEEEEEEDALNETAAGATQQGAKTVNFAADMDMSLATAQFAGARTVNLDMPMDIEEEDEEKKSSEQDEDVEQQREAEEEEMTARDRLNQGFTKDWAADARTVNFAAPMDVEEEEEDEEDDEEADIRTQWNLNTTSHMAAADAVRKSLEMGELMGRSSLGRRSMDRLSSGAERLSFGRSSPKRESLSNRESLLSPVEETGEPEEEMSPLTRPAAPLPSAPVAVAPVVLAPVAVAPMPPKKALPVPPKKKEAPAKQRAAVATERPPMGGRVMVEHPIAGVQVAVPQSRLPGLFDRRYSTRRIIRNFGHELPSMSDDGDAAEEMDVEEEVAVHESFAVAAEPTRKRRAADEDSVVDNARRASMRQSIAPGELPMSDFLWLANVRFAEEQPVQALAPAVAAPVPSLCSTEIAALEREMELLLAAGETLKAEIAAEERSLMSSDNPLFTAMQTSDQAVLVAAQSDLAELKRLCLLQAETEALSAAVSLSAGARSNFRQVGERAVRDTRTIYQQTGLMHMEREKLRSARIAALEEICVMREQQQRQQKNAAAATGSAKLMASVFEALTHCSVVLSEENRTEVVICEAVRLVVGQATVECSLVDNIDAWRANLIRATGVLGRTARLPEASLQSLVEPVRAKMLRCNAGAKELRSLARRINVVYPDSNDMVDIYFSSKSAMAILHVSHLPSHSTLLLIVLFFLLQIPCAAIAAYPSRSAAEGGAPTVTVLKSSGDASRLLAVVREGCSGVGCFAQLCSRVAQEFQRL